MNLNEAVTQAMNIAEEMVNDREHVRVNYIANGNFTEPKPIDPSRSIYEQVRELAVKLATRPDEHIHLTISFGDSYKNQTGHAEVSYNPKKKSLYLSRREKAVFGQDSQLVRAMIDCQITTVNRTRSFLSLK